MDKIYMHVVNFFRLSFSEISEIYETPFFVYYSTPKTLFQYVSEERLAELTQRSEELGNEINELENLI